MKTPIQYALTYPDRAAGCGRTMDWQKAFSMRFEPPDFERFGALKLAYEVAAAGGTAGAVLNAANEAAVAAFVAGQIPFNAICRVVERTIRRHRVQAEPSLDDLLQADQWARQTAGEMALESVVPAAANAAPAFGG
jgi:1-deoxy-D-xylulose-5-phosphate reductoisomerase